MAIRLIALLYLFLSAVCVAQIPPSGGSAGQLWTSNGKSPPSWQAGSSSASTGYIYATTYGVSTSNTDNGPDLNTFFAAVAKANGHGVLPPGILNIQTPLVIDGGCPSGCPTNPTNGYVVGQSIELEGSGTSYNYGSSQLNLGAGTYIYWSGSTTTSPMLTLSGLGKLKWRGIGMSGNSSTGSIIFTTQPSGSYSNPYNFHFEDFFFGFPGSGYAGFQVDPSNGANNAKFIFTSGAMNGFAGTYGYYSSSNYTAIDNEFESVSFSGGGTSTTAWHNGIYLAAGSVTCHTCEFSGAGTASGTDADIYVGAATFSGRDLWSQGSNRFMWAADKSTVLIERVITSSFPWSYWKQGFTSTQPSNTADQYATIVSQTYNPSYMTIMSSSFIDPFNGAQGTITPTMLYEGNPAPFNLYAFNNGCSLGASPAVSYSCFGYESGSTFEPVNGYNSQINQPAEFWEANCPVVTSSASIAFTNGTPTVGTWSSPPWAASANSNVPYGSFACPFYISATAPTGLSTNTTYWAVPQSATTFNVSTSAANAMAGTYAATSGSTTTSTLVSSTYQVSSTTVVAVGAMNLTAGDWDCQMSGIFLPASTTSVTNLQAGINSSGTAIGTLGSYADFETAANIMTATNNPILVSPMFRESLLATTAEYAVTDGTFTASTMTESGDFRCRRMR